MGITLIKIKDMKIKYYTINIDAIKFFFYRLKISCYREFFWDPDRFGRHYAAPPFFFASP